MTCAGQCGQDHVVVQTEGTLAVLDSCGDQGGERHADKQPRLEKS